MPRTGPSRCEALPIDACSFHARQGSMSQPNSTMAKEDTLHDIHSTQVVTRSTRPSWRDSPLT